jgi:hypothetical protein
LECSQFTGYHGNIAQSLHLYAISFLDSLFLVYNDQFYLELIFSYVFHFYLLRLSGRVVLHLVVHVQMLVVLSGWCVFNLEQAISWQLLKPVRTVNISRSVIENQPKVGSFSLHEIVGVANNV